MMSENMTEEITSTAEEFMNTDTEAKQAVGRPTSQRPIKVLHLLYSMGGGGIARQLCELLRGIQSDDSVYSELFTMSDQMHSAYTRDLDKLLPIHCHDKNKVSKKDIMAALSQVCRDMQPDIIQSWDLFSGMFAVPMARKHKAKFVNFVIQNAPAHIPVFGKTWLMSRFTFAFADIIIGNSQAGLDAYHRSGAHCRVIYNGFDFSRVKNLKPAPEIRDQFKITTSRVVGMVARFTAAKDYKTYVQAALEIVKQYDDVTFMAIGTGPNLESCRAMVPEAFRDRILFPGQQAEVESIVNVFDIGVLATYTEGISNSITEYMALGKPVVATDGGGTKELVAHEETGFLVRTSDVDDLKNRIETLLNSPDLTKKMGDAGRERVHKMFDMPAMIDNFAKLYHNLR